VYCLTAADTEHVAFWLRARGIDAVAYSGETENEEPIATEQRLLDNHVKVVAATSALGMGFDKPDLGLVIHYQSPGSAIAYYQQVGRAGRQLESSFGILLSAAEEATLTVEGVSEPTRILRDAPPLVVERRKGEQWRSMRQPGTACTTGSNRSSGPRRPRS